MTANDSWGTTTLKTPRQLVTFMSIKVKTTQSADSQEAPREMIGYQVLTVGLDSQLILFKSSIRLK